MEIEIGTIDSMKSINKFLSNTTFNDGCVEWSGSLMHKGYGSFYFKGTTYRAHRYAFMVANGIRSLPDDKFVCHSCDNRKCVNPEHLWLGDNSSNMLDCIKKGRYVSAQRNKTHCKHGHIFDEENTHIYKGFRICKQCRREYSAMYKKKMRLDMLLKTKEELEYV